LEPESSSEEAAKAAAEAFRDCCGKRWRRQLASIDVVIPCYNYGHFLPECIGSVLSQGVEDLRVIVIDNASTDDSVGVARRLAAQDPRVEVVCHEKNLGPHASFNEAIDRAEADYFMILCADDILTADTLIHGMTMLDSFPRISCVLGTFMEASTGMPDLAGQSGGGDLMEGTTFIERCCRTIGQNVAPHAILARTSLQKEVGHYRASLPFYDDLEMVLRFARMGPVAELRGPMVIRRIHSTGLTVPLWKDKLRDLQEREAVFESFFGLEGADLSNSLQLRRIARRRIAEAAFWSAAAHLFRSRAKEANQLLKYGYRLDPSLWLRPPVGHLFRTPGTFKRIANVISGSK
jgi:glycosyltransferase involved in cell wall biosynthesis